jgi:hypothetical protein
VNRGADLYAGGRYIEAAEVFERTERRLPGATSPDRARYGLYRGATLLALGDARHAQNWLSFSAQIVQVDRASLSEEERLMLERALQLVNERRAAKTMLATPEGSAVATSRPIPATVSQPINPAAD